MQNPFSNADYHLTSGSPAIDTGTTACTSGGISPCVPNVDLDNISRPQGTAYDIGAYEYGGTSTSLPTISSFSASPTSITSGQTATLSWTTSGATSASITNVGSVAVSGSATVSPTTTTTYTLTATNSAGSVTQSVTITVASSSGGPAGYTFCANEGGTCSFTGTMSVAYGANGLFFYQTLTEPGWNGACNNTTFGDPDFGVVKACYTQAIASAVSVSISPTSATLASGGQQQFTATVSNCGTNCGVTWSASQGSITSGGLFTAPTVSVSTIVTVVATSQADTTKSASASVTVNPGTATYSFWSNSYVPSGSYTTDNSVENGIRFHSTTNGYVTGIRFYKGSSSDNGTHLGHLWNASGSLLASATFTNETASGWQTVSFSQPVAVSANTDYVASEFTSSGYVYVPNFFNSSFSSGPLIAPATSASTPNGTYIYSATGAFPTQTYSGTNYWVDVVFTPSTTTVSAPSITSSLSSSATINQSYSYQITASNSPTSYGASNLPAGLTVNTANGLISGTPTTAGTYSITLSATNSGGTGSATLTLTVGSGGGTIQTGGAFDINDRMTVTCNVKVRATPGGTQISVEQTGSKGTVIGGPVDSGARWWQINYDNGVSGWSSQGTGCLWKYFTSGERILVQNGPLNVRSAAGTASTILGTQASGALGTITGGPTYLNGYQWWNINYDTNPLGWSAANSWGQSYLTAAQ